MKQNVEFIKVETHVSCIAWDPFPSADVTRAMHELVLVDISAEPK